MVTRDDVAKLAGVSPSVVSYVVNDSNYVSKEKRQAVLQAIKELGYYPNSLARSLKSGKSKQFLIITDDIRNEMFSEVTYYMEPEAYKKGYSLTSTSCTQNNYDDLLNSLNSKQYAGVFIFSGVVPLNKKHVEKLNQLACEGIPIVLFMFIKNSTPFHSSITVLRPNIREAVCKAVDYLLDKEKHCIIGYLGDGNPLEGGESEPFGDGLRINGYLDSLYKHHIEPKKDYIFFLDEFKYPCRTFMNVEGVIDSYFLLKEGERPTAYFVNSDMMAAKLISRFLSRGISIPEMVEVVGFGDTLSASIVVPQLTTVAMPCQEIGERAIRILMQKVDGEKVQDEFFNLQLIKRDSA